MRAHAAATLFPLLAGDAFDALVDDIRTRGLVHPIVIFEDRILDGRNRWRACKAAKVEPRTELYRGNDPVGYVISTNIARRHLDESQVKDRAGLGHYFRQRHELLLVAARGTVITPPPSERRDSVFEIAKGQHSEKPAEVAAWIERAYPTLPKIELFCRAPRTGWAAWGNQAVAS